MLLEIIALSAEDAKVASDNGANRVEWIANPEEGGLTPPLGELGDMLEASPVPVHVMVRPHSRDFVYTDDETDVMLRDIRAIGKSKAGAVVVGGLTPDGRVDEEKLKRLLDAADGKAVTFHRAFDEVRSQEEALATLSRYPQIATILTSGGKPSALDAASELRRLVELSAGTGIEIMAGSGLTVDSLQAFASGARVRAVHMGSGVRLEGRQTRPIDPRRVFAARLIIDQFAVPMGDETE